MVKVFSSEHTYRFSLLWNLLNESLAVPGTKKLKEERLHPLLLRTYYLKNQRKNQIAFQKYHSDSNSAIAIGKRQHWVFERWLNRPTVTRNFRSTRDMINLLNWREVRQAGSFEFFLTPSSQIQNNCSSSTHPSTVTSTHQHIGTSTHQHINSSAHQQITRSAHYHIRSNVRHKDAPGTLAIILLQPFSFQCVPSHNIRRKGKCHYQILLCLFLLEMRKEVRPPETWFFPAHLWY